MASWLKCTTKRDEAAVFVYGFLKNDFVIIIANAGASPCSWEFAMAKASIKRQAGDRARYP